MENSKRGSIPMQDKQKLCKSQGASTPDENITIRYQHNPGELHWIVVKNILKYLRNTKDMFLSQTRYVFILNGGVIDWKSTKQSIFVTSFEEAEYIAASDASKEAVWIRKFIYGLGVVPTNKESMMILGLKSHVEEDTSSTNLEWCKLDDLIKMWILGSLCDSLQEQVVTAPGNAKALWDHLKDLFHDNKDARAISLDNELHSIKIGKMAVNEYCTKIKSMADRLKNLGCQVSEKNMVIYAVNGLDSRFATLVEII
ncbi:hypothetical protein Tco_1008075 [Tanacetum coccineum]